VLHTLTSIIAAVPDPGQGQQPPGSDGIVKILGWAAWVAVVICVLGVLIAGATMAIQHRRGEGGESMARLGWVLGGVIVIGSASALVGALV
jgi:hypothetical protein